MKIKLLVLFCVATFLLPIAVFVITGVLGIQHPLLKYSIAIASFLCSVVGFTLYVLKRRNVVWYLLFLIVVLSLLIELITSPLRGYDIFGIPGGFRLCSVVTFALYFLFINLMLKKHASKLKPKRILLACLIGCCLIQLPLRLIHFNSTLVSLPDFLFHLFGIFMGYLFYVSGKYLKSGIVLISLFCCIFLYKGYDLWSHKLNFDTFTGMIAEKYQSSIIFQNDEGENINLDNLEGEYIVLDFWTSSCGVCFRKFPEVQRIYDKWRDNEQMRLYGVFCRYEKNEETPATGTKILQEIGYTFPSLSIDIKNPILKEFGVNVYPTVLIFNNKDRTLIFRGRIEYAEKLLNKILK